MGEVDDDQGNRAVVKALIDAFAFPNQIWVSLTDMGYGRPDASSEAQAAEAYLANLLSRGEQNIMSQARE